MFRFPLSPTPTDDGAFSPSPLALRIATSDTTDYRPLEYDNTAIGDARKVLVVCTEQRNMTMANGKKFSTGNHPVEMLVPMMHLRDAGFELEIVTPTGAPVQIEMWAMPRKDEAVMSFYDSFKTQFERPGTVTDFVNTQMHDDSPYIGVFLPGGHGAMLGLPENEAVGKILRWFHHQNLHTLAICHGPAALLAAHDSSSGESFLYDGYKMAAFPDSVDKQTPWIGYMPGHMPWRFGEKLRALGVQFVNTKADDTCHTDRRLITGASPKAANAFGQMAARELLASISA